MVTSGSAALTPARSGRRPPARPAPLPDADRDALLDGLRGWLWRLSERFAGAAGVEPADFFQAVCLDVLKHAGDYDPARGRRTTWAYERARHVRTDLARQSARHDPANRPGAGDQVHPDALPARPAPAALDLAADAEARALVRRAIASLSARKRRLVVRRFGLNGKPPAKLADLRAEFGLSRGRLEDLLAAALADLHRRLRPLKPADTL